MLPQDVASLNGRFSLLAVALEEWYGLNEKIFEECQHEIKK
ncbi:hypothetical protein [Bacillus sp. 03113]|nr:hypothetical protein [Bacillus sp. 03113]